jgi:hypothetical protein
MKKANKLAMVAATLSLGAVSSFAEIKLTDNLSTAGFVDMSLNGHKDSSKTDASLGAGLDQFETDFMYKYGNVSARADINALPTGAGTSVTVEQAYITGTMGAVAVSAGRFLSSSGWEAAEPTGMYQWSYSRQFPSLPSTYGDAGAPVYGGYQNGVNVAWTSPMFGLYGAVVSDLWSAQEFEIMKTPGFEGQVSVTPAAGVTAKATYLYQLADTSVARGRVENQSLLNVWASYAKGPLTAAAEWDLMMNWGGIKDFNGNGWLVMANYKFTDKAAATVRYSGNKFSLDTPAGKLDADTQGEITLSPSWAFSPNWLILAEYKYVLDIQNNSYAIETTFSY